MWREKHYEYWRDVGPAAEDGTLVSDSWGQHMHADCLDRCAATCESLGSEPGYAALAAAVLDADAPHRGPVECFESDEERVWQFGWITSLHACFIVALACTVLGAWCLGCCVSNRCCYGYEALQRVRNEFADASAPASRRRRRRGLASTRRRSRRQCLVDRPRGGSRPRRGRLVNNPRDGSRRGRLVNNPRDGLWRGCLEDSPDGLRPRRGRRADSPRRRVAATPRPPRG